MKKIAFRGILVAAFALILAGGAVWGQSNAPTSFSKIAVIYSEAFADDKAGISRLAAIRKTLEQEFEPTRKDLMKLKTQMDGLEKELRDGTKVPDINSAANKSRQLERMKREFGFRSNEANTTFEERYAELAKPISDDISKALAEFARKNGIAVLIDASKTGGVYVYNDAVDMTGSFVAYFNSLPLKQ